MRAIPNGMRLANRSDEAIVINLMLKSFWNDPHFSWLAGYPTNNANKTLRFTALLKLMFAEMMIYNSVIITDDNDGCVFYKDSPRLRLSRDYVVACLRFAFAVGSTQIVRILKHFRIPLHMAAWCASRASRARTV
ncbi:MAG: hypothetical protein NTV34_15760 [Proteobacteria bacterium]|nr:hypothetical protein [Pseudomonadota bacterium]